MDYRNMETQDFIEMILKKKELCPCLMIGKYVNEFKRMYKDVIERVYTLKDVKRVVEEYEGVDNVNSGVLVLEGVGYLSDTGQNSLLKFIEESKLPIIILSYNDSVSPIIHSRMKTVVKRWYEVKSLDFMKVGDAQRTLNEKKRESDFKEYQEIQFMADYCPPLYSIKELAGDPFDYSNNRLINIMCNTIGGR